MCPTDDTLGALVQHALDDREAREVTSHLDTCAACREVVIAAVRGGIATPVTMAIGTPSLPKLQRGFEPSRVGTKLGRYELRKLLGAGGMGAVYDAYDGELDRSIALKVLRSELAAASGLLAERLLRESRLMAKVVHPSVITVYDVGRHDDSVFIAMELIRGQTLGAYLAQHELGWREIVALFERAGQGLAAAHATGIVHRDFKPDNVLVSIDHGRVERVVVTDFGIARAIALGVPADKSGETIADEPSEPSERPSDVRLTRTGAAIGTPAYMAPEQLDGKPVDLRADEFAFAVSLWEALFRQRPFPGASVDDIRRAMQAPPVVPRHRLPRRLVRALERALAIDPGSRWPDLPALLRELAASRGQRRRTAIAAAALGVVGAGVTGALVLAQQPADDRCEHALDRIASAYRPVDAMRIAAVLAAEPLSRDAVLDRLTTVQREWTATHAETCSVGREPIQDPGIAACLEARRVELAGFVDDALHDGAEGAAWASVIAGTIGDPAACAHPAPGLSFAHTPEEPELRRKVTRLRYRAFAAEAQRDRGEFAAALAAEQPLVDEAAKLWPPLHAEVLYLVGGTESQGGDTRAGLATMREAAAIAERAHHDYIAANAWIQLALSTASDEGDPTRALEYTTYADAALDRIGRPPDITTLFEYVKGSTLVDAGRSKDGEAVLRHAVELAETRAPDYLPQAIMGLGYLYEDQGRYTEAVDAYKRALAHLPETGAGVVSSVIVFRERIAINLAILGNAADAVPYAKEAVAIAERTLGKDNLDRAVAHSQLAQVLDELGRYEAALPEAIGAVDDIRRLQGDRSERYGEVLSLQANILDDLDRHAEALKLFERACDVIAFATGESSAQVANCWLGQAAALSGLGRHKESLALMDKVVAIFTSTYGADHPQTANAVLNRGSVHSDLDNHAAAIADYERAIVALDKLALDPGHLAASKWALAKELWLTDPKRAHYLIAEALTGFHSASANWSKYRDDAAEWLATNGKPTRSSSHRRLR